MGGIDLRNVEKVCWLAFMALVSNLASAVDENECTVSTQQKHIEATTKLVLRTEECPDEDRRVITVAIRSNSAPSRIVFRKTQRLSDAPTGGGHFLAFEGIPVLQITGGCGLVNCEEDLYRLSEDRRSMYHYYTGGYSSVSFAGTYLITESRGGGGAWEFLAYDLAAIQKYPIGKIFHYSIYVEAIDSKPSGEVVKSRCTISTLGPKNRLAIAKSPPGELLKYCENYGKNYVLAKARGRNK